MSKETRYRSNRKTMSPQVLSELDRYRSARLVIDRYGSDARLEAARCADAQLILVKATWKAQKPGLQ